MVWRSSPLFLKTSRRAKLIATDRVPETFHISKRQYQICTTTCTSDKPDLIKCHIVNFYIPLLYNFLFNACMRKNHIMWRDHKCVFVLPEACSLLKRRFMKSKLQDIFGLKELQMTSYRCFYYITRLTSILTDGEVCLKMDIKGKHVFA